MFAYNEIMNPVYSRHNDARFQTGAGMLAACFTGSDWGAWSNAGNDHSDPPRPPHASGLYQALRRGLSTWLARHSERRAAKALAKQLARCNESLLKDIGFTHGDIFALQHGRLTVAEAQRLRDERNAKTYWTRETASVSGDDYDWPQAA